jgi:hypothetical protein
MKGFAKMKLPAALLVLAAAHLSLFHADSSASNHLLGCWQCRMEIQTVILEFRSENILIFAGEPTRYSLFPGVIRVEEEYGSIDYPYRLDGESLSIRFPDGGIVRCTRSFAPPVPGGSDSGTVGVQKPPPPTPPQSSSGEKPAVSPEEIGDPAWGFAFKPPGDWKFRKDHNGVLLGHDTIAGMILVFPHEQTHQKALAAQMREGILEQGVSIQLSGDLSRTSGDFLQGEYAGTVRGEEAKARGIGTLSPHGGGAYILAISTPEKFSRAIVQAAETIAGNMRYFKADFSHLIRIFAGRWASYSGSSGGGTLMNYTFHRNGVFEDASETSYSSEYSSDGWGTPDSYMGAVGTNLQRAQWSVRGSERQGQIRIRYPGGKERWMDYQVHVQSGQTYWREYLFDGRLFQKQEHY